MSDLKGTLSDYVTVAMAVEMLGHKREQTGRFYNYVSNGLETYKLGGITLAKVKDFTSAAGLPAGTSSLWPAELASLPMSKLLARNEAANVLGVAPGTINHYAKIGKVKAYDLSPWGGRMAYVVDENGLAPKYMHFGDWTIKASESKDGFNVTLRVTMKENLE
jgi:hypothetical protein